MNIERSEGHFKDEIFYQSWTNRDAFATLVVTHGMGEHSESYAKTAAALCALGWNVIAWDLRGHGRSEGKRGHVDRFTDYADDLNGLLRYLGKNGHLNLPFALVAHSMGGLVVLDHLMRNSDAPEPRAVALSSPLLGVAIKVPPVKDFAAKLMNKVWPSMTLFNEIKVEDLTRDTEHHPSYARDPLRHEKISPALYFGIYDTIAKVSSAGPLIKLPILIQAAGQETA
ncbi:MAG: lysophospholipase, partial [Bdellovibrionota bacterium]